jgi:molybdenum cofactor biosynthesis protein B
MNKNIRTFKALNICILVISDTRNKTSDKSGRVLEKKIKESGHIIFDKIFIKDEPKKN